MSTTDTINKLNTKKGRICFLTVPEEECVHTISPAQGNQHNKLQSAIG
jgi:hypothetical protein